MREGRPRHRPCGQQDARTGHQQAAQQHKEGQGLTLLAAAVMPAVVIKAAQAVEAERTAPTSTLRWVCSLAGALQPEAALVNNFHALRRT